ncbi:MAG: methylmalonyl-CoA mutase [Caulobacteraceae bacterium]|nr:methylmalonyl-CoA mutase [Caulobacteraceae bacterium]
MSVEPLASEFPVADEARWRALVEKGLKGKAFDSLVSTTADGLTIKPLYTAADAGFVLKARPAPGADLDRPWDLRAVCEHPDPARANAQVLADLTGGAQSVLLRLDPGGRAGAAAASQDDLARVLAGVYLELAPVALDAGWMGPDAANWLAVLAKGAPNAPLAFHLDPVTAFAQAGRSPGVVEGRLNAAAQTSARHAQAYPRMTAFLACGRAAHEAGGSGAQELGLMAASAVSYLRSMVDEAGMEVRDALGRIVLGVSVDGDVLASIARLRAARAIWARLAEIAGAPAAPCRIEARSSDRMLARRDAWTNLLRLTAAGFAAGVGGADAVVLAPFTRPLGLPSDLARRQARNIQLVLMEEAGLGRVADPAGGAWALEDLTGQTARAGWEQFQRIEADGGVFEALRKGRLQAEVAALRDARLADIAERRTPLLGVTTFPPVREDPIAVDPAPDKAPERPYDLAAAGEDSRCEPLTPLRWSAAFEETDQ